MKSEAEKELIKGFSDLLGSYGSPPLLEALIEVVKGCDVLALNGEIRKIYWDNISFEGPEDRIIYSVSVEAFWSEDDE